MINFLCVGGIKCGTTSLRHYLNQHPDIAVPFKDSYVFMPEAPPDSNNPKMEYSEWHSKTEQLRDVTGKLIGEVASDYLVNADTTVDAINKICGRDLKILVMLREPVQRAWSHWMYTTSNYAENDSFPDAILEELRGFRTAPYNRMYVMNGKWPDYLWKFRGTFPNVHVETLENLATDPDGTMRRIFDFLAVDYHPVDTSIISNTSGIPKYTPLHWMLLNPTWFHKRIQRMLTRTFGERAIDKAVEFVRSKTLIKPAIPEAERALLSNYYNNTGAVQAWKEACHEKA